MHVPDEQRSKLDDKSQKYIFIGYDTNSKGYKLYIPNTRKTIINRDFIFDEEENGIGNNRMKTTYSFHTSKKMIWSIQG